MRYLFTPERTVRTYRLYFPSNDDVLDELLRTVTRCLDHLLPAEVSRLIDREGSGLVQEKDGRLTVKRHPALQAALHELARMDLFRLFLPRAHDGLELPVAVYYLAVQLIATYDASLALTFLVHGNAMYVINRYGTEAQKQRYLPLLASGELLATVAFTEPLAGSDAGSIRTKAEPSSDGYVLTGTKRFITHGGDADLLVTTARTGPLEQGINGVSAFLVEREADGVEVLALEDKTGLNGSPTAELGYPGLQIPRDRLLGAEGQGGAVMFAGVGMTRVNIGALALGIGKRAFDAAADFALQREQGGRIIAEHDAVQQRLADMALILSAMENLICYDSLLEERGEWHVREMSLAKYFCSEALQELTLRAINVFGGYGVCKELPVERCRREAVALPLFGGTSEIQWFIIGRELVESLQGRTRCDYRARDKELAVKLIERCTGELVDLAGRVRQGKDRLWQLVKRVAAEEDPLPSYRHLAELSCSLAVAQVLLWQASAENAEELEREMARETIYRLEDEADTCEKAWARRGQERTYRATLRKRLF